MAVKPQLACFERLGAPGWAALAAVAEHARAAGLLVLADGKRGDIDVTAAAYGQALVGATPTPSGEVRGLGADAFTANPYLGRDTLAVLVAAARAAGARRLRARAHLEPRRRRRPGPAARRRRDGLGARSPGSWPSWAARTATTGRCRTSAPWPARPRPSTSAALRELLPRAPFLLPGVGAQGGRVEDLAPAFAPGRAGGLVTASRSIVRAHEDATAGPAEPATAARAEAERLRAAAWALAPASST